MADDFIYGQTARIPVTITDINDAPADPGGLVLKIRKPDKVLITLTYGIDAEIVKVATGAYYTDVLLDQSGRWQWRWEASEPDTGVTESGIDVRPSHVL